MKVKKALTDSHLSIRASEYLWETNDSAEFHRYVEGPLLEVLRRSKTQTILDLGCGNGSLTNRLAVSGFKVTGCDSSASGINAATSRYPEIPFFLQNLLEPIPQGHRECYDAVVCIEVVEHVFLPRRLIENAITALRPGGVLLLSTPYHGYLKNLCLALVNGFDRHWHPLRDYGHIKFFSRNTLRELVESCGLEILSFRTIGRIPPLARSMMICARRNS